MERRCAGSHCGRSFVPNPRVKNQHYCSCTRCQKERKALWQKRKQRIDAEYKENQSSAQREWRKKHPSYWRNYRKMHPLYTEKNRALQRERNRKARDAVEGARALGDVVSKGDLPMIAKMDALSRVKPGTYRLVPVVPGVIAKMDALLVQLSLLPEGYGNTFDCKDRTR